MRLSLLLCVLLGASVACGLSYEYIDYDTNFEIMGGKGGPGFGFGGKGRGGYGASVTFVQPVVQQAYAPVHIQKQAPQQIQVQPIFQTKQAQPIVQLQQPVLQFQQQQAPIYQAPVQTQKPVRYAQPIVTYAQPIVQQLDMTPPNVQKQSYTAQPIIQPTFQTAPVQNVQPIMATAPTIQKGYGAGLGLGGANWAQQGNPQQFQMGGMGGDDFGMGGGVDF